MGKNIIVSASVLDADFCRLGAAIERVSAAGADWIHIDVMDGRFVENISFGAVVQKCIPDHYFKDTHLMVSDPLPQLEHFARAGSGVITFHAECEREPEQVIDRIRSLRANNGGGIKAGIAIKPATPAEAIFPYISMVDLILVMTVEPGYGGQGFLPETLGKVTAIREKALSMGLDPYIQVDGGINPKTAFLAARAGADVMVSGTCLLHSDEPAETVRQIKRVPSR